MLCLFSKLTSFLSLRKDQPVSNVAHQLLERADAGAGRDPHEAQEMRGAARAFLSVIR